ncbi:hypothetical protein [Nostoc sp. NMS9]|nr:hypothetical protein [Nostoc sp. NMS9]MBN3938726.1 hypothetical protein [Nostoc sp. NMS9]
MKGKILCLVHVVQSLYPRLSIPPKKRSPLIYTELKCDRPKDKFTTKYDI